MLKKNTEIFAGIFDSSILRKGETHTRPRKISSYELEIFQTDSGTVFINEQQYPVKRGMLLCTKPGQIRHTMLPIRSSFIHANPNDHNHDIAQILSELPTCTYIDNEESIDLLMSLISRLSLCCISSDDSLIKQIQLNWLFLDIIYRCMQITKKENKTHISSSNDHLIQTAYEYINEHYTSNDCTLKNIADAIGLTPNHVHSIFKRATGNTPFAYMMTKRIDLAKRLIMMEQKSFLEISFECGFSSQSHFIKVFKKATGVTPVVFRQILSEKYDDILMSTMVQKDEQEISEEMLLSD